MKLIFFNGNKATKLLMTNHAKWHETEEFEDRNSSKVKIKMSCPWNSHTVYFCKRQRSYQTMTKRNFNITFCGCCYFLFDLPYYRTKHQYKQKTM